MQKKTLLSRRTKYGYFFTAPWIIGLVVFVFFPAIEAGRIALSELMVGEFRYTLKFTGLDNFKRIFLVETKFRELLISSFSRMLYSVLLVIIFSFFLASVLNMQFKGRAVVRSVLFLPVILTSGAIDRLLADDYMTKVVSTSTQASGNDLAAGFLNVIGDFNLPEGLLNFIAGAVGEIYSITVMSAVPIVIFIAALHSISDSLYEAAYIEGASAWEVYWKIKFPLVSPHILVCIIYCIIDSLNNAANPVVNLIKKTTYGDIKYGYGAAMSFAYMAITLIIVFVVYKAVSRWVVYSD